MAVHCATAGVIPATAWEETVKRPVEGGVQLEADLDRAIENVAHLTGVVAQSGRQLGVQGAGVRGELVVVMLGEVDGEVVGH